MDFIREAVKTCHVELTTLVVPGENDSEEEMRELSEPAARAQPRVTSTSSPSPPYGGGETRAR